uniref:Uncharacterized protein n=1 Tax=Tanacetum cinerariifolium TaxID=118510 RepID=A0A699WLJ6_TANCI|nr:hypothetical protein [Tanacetum cinerariifolium]
MVGADPGRAVHAAFALQRDQAAAGSHHAQGAHRSIAPPRAQWTGRPARDRVVAGGGGVFDHAPGQDAAGAFYGIDRLVAGARSRAGSGADGGCRARGIG